VRGSRFRGGWSDDLRRSILARVGEPLDWGGRVSAEEVHPRACGGAEEKEGQAETGPGLSPRVRGNRRRVGAQKRVFRSIPARAGKPQPASGDSVRSAVHPRACGKAVGGGDGGARTDGPSSRVRGNPKINGARRTGPSSRVRGNPYDNLRLVVPKKRASSCQKGRQALSSLAVWNHGINTTFKELELSYDSDTNLAQNRHRVNSNLKQLAFSFP
jgi:hypothetical protein